MSYMVRVKRYGQMIISMKEILNKTRNMEKEYSYGMMGLAMRDHLKIIIWKDKEYIDLQMEEYILDNLN